MWSGENPSSPKTHLEPLGQVRHMSSSANRFASPDAGAWVVVVGDETHSLPNLGGRKGGALMTEHAQGAVSAALTDTGHRRARGEDAET